MMMKQFLQSLLKDLEWTQKEWIGYFSFVLILSVFAYYGRPSWLAITFDVNSSWQGLPYLLRAVAGLMIRVLIPMGIIIFIFKEKLDNYGFGFQWQARYINLLCWFVLGATPLLWIVSYQESFQHKYPFYHGAGQSWFEFLTYESLRLLEFVGMESFFRGYLLFFLFKRFGYQSLWMMAIPCMMLHFGTPFIEVLISFPMAMIMGYLALRTKTWWYGAMAHWLIALIMDSFAIFQKISTF